MTTDSEQYYKILRQYWGYTEFRPLQLDIISSVGRGESSLALMPTGGGKSITFQVPAMALDGLCLVVSPLVALMKDQVENLRARGIKDAAVYSGMTHDQILT
ncbi:MAG: DEAD/DEAH box helicase, partial [Bacteroidota bacterium]